MLVPKGGEGGRGLHDFLKLVLVCASDCKIRDLRRFQLALDLGYDAIGHGLVSLEPRIP